MMFQCAVCEVDFSFDVFVPSNLRELYYMCCASCAKRTFVLMYKERYGLEPGTESWIVFGLGSRMFPKLSDYSRLIESFIEEREVKIVSPDQICSGCKLPAPHAKPNVDSEYVCPGCIMLAVLTD